jgi:poly(A) polymerase
MLKLLGLADPSATVAIMLDRGILKPVLPEIEKASVANLKNVISAERESGVGPEALRRLAALLPRDPAAAEAVGARLTLSNKARKRLACAANPDIALPPRALAYRIGPECALDRLLLAGRAAEAATIADWQPPRLPIGGGALVKRGVEQGPVVARTLRAIEDRWVEAGFPAGETFERIVDDALGSAS